MNPTINRFITLSVVLTTSMLSNANSNSMPSAIELLDSFEKTRRSMNNLHLRAAYSADVTRVTSGVKKVQRRHLEVTVRSESETGKYEIVTAESLGDVHDRTALEKLKTTHQVWDGTVGYSFTNPSEAEKTGQLGYTLHSSGSMGRESPSSDSLPHNTGGELLEGVFWDNRPIHDIFRDEMELTVREQTETIGGFPCYVLEASGKYGDFTVWMDPARQYAIRRVELKKDSDDLGWADNLLSDMNLSSVNYVMKDVEIEERDGVYLAKSGNCEMEWTYLNGDKLESKKTITINEIDFNPDFEALDAFKVTMPDGTPIRDSDFPAIQYTWVNGKAVPDVAPSDLDVLDGAIEDLKKSGGIVQEARPIALEADRRTPEATREGRLAYWAMVIGGVCALTGVGLRFLYYRARRNA